jgi:aryl-alcohol dehydrogenase-like predicted oxidoreductase
MRYQLLGKTGLRVSEICLGAMVFGDHRGSWGASGDDSVAIMSAFADAGGNFVDTACNYAGGESERIVGEFTASNRDSWVLATKYSVSPRPDDPNAGGNHRKSLVQALDTSLKRLKTDHIDLYWVHACDPLTPVAEVVRALDDQVRAGKILYVGVSDAPAWRIAKATTLAAATGLSRFEAMQIPYSLIERTVERELLPLAHADELTVTAWAPLGGGLLTGRYGAGKDRPTDTRLAGIGGQHEAKIVNPRTLAIADAVNTIAESRNMTAGAVAIAWVRSQIKKARIIPIVGARTAEQLATNLRALELNLTSEELARLDEVSRIDLGFPHDFDVSGLVYGRTRPLIDVPESRA